MLKKLTGNNWVVGLIIFSLPIVAIFFLGSQMAYSQVIGRFEAYQEIPEITSLAALEAVPPGKTIMLRGVISADTLPRNDVLAPDLVVFQERPADREVRFREEFPLVFSNLVLDLPDGQVQVNPSTSREQVIQHELHTVPAGDRLRTGFRIGDEVTVQGQWQPSPQPVLKDVTGMTGISKETLIANWQSNFQKVVWARNILGALTILGLVLLIVQLRRSKTNKANNECPTPNPTTTAPTA